MELETLLLKEINVFAPILDDHITELRQTVKQNLMWKNDHITNISVRIFEYITITHYKLWGFSKSARFLLQVILFNLLLILLH